MRNAESTSGAAEAGGAVVRRYVASASVAVAMALCACAATVVGALAQATDPKPITARTVWDGVFTADQADRGRAEYASACASCHAEDLRGSSTAPSLVDESFSFQWNDTTVDELFVRIRTLMPSDRPNSLSSRSYRDVVAFILQSNRFPSGNTELDGESEALRQILITTKRPEPKP
jgi:mono/diheme cytochrome c family protein